MIISLIGVKKMKKAVVLLHGLLARAYVMRFIKKQMVDAGYEVYVFDYISRRYSSNTLDKLHDLISQIPEQEIYLIGHSMGGLVGRNYIHQYENNIKGLITIATPHNQSICAHNATKRFKRFLGTAGDSGLTLDLPQWSSSAVIGCIAGKSKAILYKNLFLIFHKNKSESDGTVYLKEAILENCHDSIIVNGSHTALLFNKEVVNQCISFIQNRSFIKSKELSAE